MNIKLLSLIMFVAMMAACKDVSVTGVILDKNSLSLPVNCKDTLTVTIAPDDATDKNVRWETDHPSVATVQGGVVTAIGQGTATITVTAVDGGSAATCTVTVTIPVEPEMVLVEGGTFWMGCNDNEDPDCIDWEKPLHQVTLTSFSIGKYELTQKQWVSVMGFNPSGSSLGDQYPVQTVYWDVIQRFIKRLNESTGKKYRLPTEAEWEYAARGGAKSKGFRYSGSNELNSVAWNPRNSNGISHMVGTKEPNELGIYDMSGNVWEVCSDWQAGYSSQPALNPTGSEKGTCRINRGGAFWGGAIYCRVAYRSCFNPTETWSTIGFRLVLPHE